MPALSPTSVARLAAPTLAVPTLALALIAATPASGTLIVEVENVRNASGLIHVDVCPRAHFLKDGCPFVADVPAHAGVTEVILHDLPAGAFAVQATHDENANHKVDRGLFGIPREGVGFSRDARIMFGPPRWDDAVIAFDGGTMHVPLHLRYFFGPSGAGNR